MKDKANWFDVLTWITAFCFGLLVVGSAWMGLSVAWESNYPDILPKLLITLLIATGLLATILYLIAKS